MINNDAIGDALLAYYNHKDKTDIVVKSSITEDDLIPIHYLFRAFNEMPIIEQKALECCLGNVLDVGAASGCHSLILNDRGLDVKAIDISKGAVELMKLQGINVQQLNFYDEKEQYDTLLFLMNGVGIAGTLKGLPIFLNHAKSLLKPNGQILLDSSDISYLYEEEDGSVWMNLNSTYYGEVTYQMKYKNCLTEPFNWLFVDYESLAKTAKECGLNCELIYEGEHYDYLARLTLK
ncbi:MAG: methyltransferase domain-containing protein [Vicingaceae bacterium]|nr:methyltransferase domain-containing protein [Vicingaceae bacterium]